MAERGEDISAFCFVTDFYRNTVAKVLNILVGSLCGSAAGVDAKVWPGFVLPVHTAAGTNRLDSLIGYIPHVNAAQMPISE